MGSNERSELVGIARRLEEWAEELGKNADSGFDALLEEFNRRCHAGCSAHTFRYLHQSQEPEELVDQLLAARQAAKVAPPPDEDLKALIRRAWTDPDVSYADTVRAEKRLAEVSRMPFDVFVAAGAFVPIIDEFIAYVSEFEAIETREQLLTMTRAYLDARVDGPRLVAVLGERIVSEAQARLRLPELESLVRAWGRRGIIDDAGAVARLRAKLSMPEVPRPASAEAVAPNPVGEAVEPAAPASPARFEHAKFGVGTLVRQSGSGDAKKLTIAFADGERTLLARFVHPLPDADAS